MMFQHASILETQHLQWPDEAACAAFAQRLPGPLLGDAFISLHGGLGAGKTTFVRHLLRALGVQGRIKSPTYAVLEPHQVAGLAISHFDFFRFDNPREWADAGFRDVFATPGLKLAEWPENAAALLPTADLALHIEAHTDGQRQVQARAYSTVGRALLAGLGTTLPRGACT
jgi:tRNA threonylcarbamoyladenosine biosynthesis protein TsaE